MPQPTRTAQQLAELKKRLSPALLGHAAVAGVGIAPAAVRVYLKRDDVDVRAQLRALVDAIEPGAPIDCVVSGDFKAQTPARGGKPPL